MKFAFVTPRYGADIGTGAEHFCRLLAEKVCDRHDVDVLTTCAHDPSTWKNELAEGSDRVHGVIVRRFPVSHAHDRAAFLELDARLATAPHARADELEWVRRLGPWCPSLIDHLKRQQRNYDAIVFFSLWHPTTVQGIVAVPEKSVVFPYLQPRNALRFRLWGEILGSARGIGLVSPAELPLLAAFVPELAVPSDMVGVGIDPPRPQSYPRHQEDPADAPMVEDDISGDVEPEELAPHLSDSGTPFRRRHRLYGSFAVYDGRVDSHNGSEELLEYFDSYAATDPEVALVLLGVKMMKLPEADYLRFPGLISERDRTTAFDAADITLAPEGEDLLTLPLLESFAVGTPVLAAAANQTAVAHCHAANAGLYYANREEFVDTLRLLTTNGSLRAKLGENGRDYVRQRFQWDAVLGRFEKLVGRVKSR